MHSIGILNRYMEKPIVEHMAGAKRVMRYVKSTLDLGLVYKKNEKEPELMGYNDYDHVSDVEDQMSISRFTHLVFMEVKSCGFVLFWDIVYSHH